MSNPDDIWRLGNYGTNALAYDVQVVGNLAYVANGSDLLVLDVIDPASIRRLGGITALGSFRSVQVEGNLAYVAASDAGLQVLEVSDPSGIRRLGGITAVASFRSVQVVGNLAYVAAFDAGLQVLDVSDPANIRPLGGYNTSGSAESVQVVGNLAYVADGSRGWQMLEVSDPANIRPLRGYETSGYAYDVRVVGNLVFVADGAGGMQVIRLSGGPGFVPGLFLEPVDQSAPPGGSVTFQVAAAGDEPLRYQWRKDGLNLVDGGRISGATSSALTINPVEAADQGAYSVVVSNAVGSVMSRPAELTSQPPEIAVQPQDLAIVKETSASFRVSATGLVLSYQWRKEGQDLVDGGRISGAKRPLLTIQSALAADQGNYSVVVSNGAGSVTSIVARLTVFEPVTVQLLGQWPGNSPGWYQGMAVVGDRLYAAVGTRGLTVFDVSNPANFRALGDYDTSGEARRVQVMGNLAFVADSYAGVQVLDVSDPSLIRRLGAFDTDGTAYDVQVVGNLAYVADGNVRVFEVSDPANIQRLGNFDPIGYARSVQVVGTQAYVAVHEAGLQVLEVSDAAHIRLLGGYDTGGFAQQVQVVDNLAYVADATAGLQVLEVSDPTNIRLLGSYDSTGYARSVQVVGNLVYVADDLAGLHVLDVSDPTNIRRLGGFNTSGRAYDVQVVGSLAYVADGAGGLQVLRLSGGPGFVPGLLLEPVDGSVPLGGSATFRAVGAGDEPLQYQWRKDGQGLVDGGRIHGAGTPVLTIFSVEAGDQGRYSVVVKNAAGSVASRPAALSYVETIHLTARLAGGRASLTLLAPPGMTVQVQYTEQLAAPITWYELTTVTAGATALEVEDPAPPTGPQRFYRAVEKP